MNNFINATASTFFVAILALTAGRMSSPEPAIPSPFGSPAVAAVNSPGQAEVLTEMLETLGKINSRLDTVPAGSGVSSQFDSGGSDGATNSPTWPTPTNPPRVTPSNAGGGSTGNRLYSTQPVVTYYGTTNYGSTGSGVSTSAYGSNGGYAQSSNSSGFSNSSGLFGRVRARTAQPVRSFRSNVTCVDGVCYPAN